MQNGKSDKNKGAGFNNLNLIAEHEQAFSQAIIDAIPGTFYLLDANVRLVGWNAYLRDEIMGVAEGEMVGLNALEYIHPDDRHTISRKMQNVLEHGAEENVEVRVLLHGGPEFRWRMLTGRRTIIDGNRYLIGMGIDITERKRAEESLIASKDRLQLIMAEVHAGSWEWFPDTNICIWSEELWRLFGLAPYCCEASYEKWLQTVIPEERARIEETLMNAVDKGVEFNLSWKVRDAEGVERVLMSKGMPFRDDDGQVNRYVGIVIDITGRYKDEEALRESEERFRKMFESHSAMQIILDPDTGVIIDANQAASSFYGWTNAEFRRMNIKQINILPVEAVRQQLDRWHDAEQLNFSFRHRRADGSIRDVDIFGNKIVIGGKAHVYCIIHDVTRRKRLESLRTFHLYLLEKADTNSVEDFLCMALDEIERLLDSSIGFCHFVRDEYATPALQVWSTNFRNMFERKLDLRGHSLITDNEAWRDVIAEKKAVIHNDIATCLNGLGIPVEQADIKRELIIPGIKGGNVEAIFGIGNKPTAYDEDDAKYLVILADLILEIISRKRAEQSEKMVQEALIQSQKMEMIGRLAGGVAHDFNNMLGVILGHSEMALEQADLPQQIHVDLQAIRKAAMRSADLTRQLLAFARKQTIIPKVLELNNIVEGMLNMLLRIIGEDISIDWIPESQPLLVKVDPTQIDQILINLCINARDAITGSGKITIETGITNIEKTSCETQFLPPEPGDYVTVSVTDNGCGVEKKHLPHIFEPFFTTKALGQGTGLGLSTVYGIVKQNNGGIECVSDPNNKTTFKIHLPRYKPHNGSTESDLSLHSITQSIATILLVEDEPDILNLCKHTLEQIGYIVLSAATPVEALNIAETHDGSIDLLLTDIMLPGMTGCELSQKLISSRPGLKTLFMSGYANNTVLAGHEECDDGVNFIQKPFSIKTLATSVEQMLMNSDSLDFQ
jgi:two-component system, cell cycle sensor histidine kinase and response regulator CckA